MITHNSSVMSQPHRSPLETIMTNIMHNLGDQNNRFIEKNREWIKKRFYVNTRKRK